MGFDCVSKSAVESMVVFRGDVDRHKICDDEQISL